MTNNLFPIRTALACLACLIGGCFTDHSFHPGLIRSQGDPSFLMVPENAPVYTNPSTFAATNPDLFWDSLVDIVGEYFRIKLDQPVHQIGGGLMEGRIETYPKAGATYLEPWQGNSVGAYERALATLQSIRRSAMVQVTPAGQNFIVSVQVFKELEDVPYPEHAISGVSSFQFNPSVEPIRPKIDRSITPPSVWLPAGRDKALEQEILARLHERLSSGPF